MKTGTLEYSADPASSFQRLCHPRNRVGHEPVDVYTPGRRVLAWTYGSWRPGKVLRAGRTRVLVLVTVNKAGRQAEKWFPLNDVKTREGR